MFNSPKQPLVEMLNDNRYLETFNYKYRPKLLKWITTLCAILSPASAFLFLTPLVKPVSIMQGPFTVLAVSISVVALFISVILSGVLLYGNHTGKSWMLLPYITVHFAASVFGVFTRAWLEKVYFKVALVCNLVSLLMILTQFLLMDKANSDQKNYNIMEGIITKYSNHKILKTITIQISLVSSVSAFLFLCPGSPLREPLPYLGEPLSVPALMTSIFTLILFVIFVILLIIGSLRDSPIMMLMYCIVNFIASVFALAMIVWNSTLFFNIAVILNLLSLIHVFIHIINVCVTKSGKLNRVISKLSIILIILVLLCCILAVIFTVMIVTGHFMGYHVQEDSDPTERWRKVNWGRRHVWARGDTRISMQ